MRTKRVLAVASGGGHWVQLLRLQAAFQDFDTAYVSVDQVYGSAIPGARFYVVSELTRFNVLKILILAPQLICILLRERPDVIITTGSAPALVCLALARVLTQARTIWIDSIANCERLSNSGRQARFFAHVWLTQWPHLASPEGPECWGAVL